MATNQMEETRILKHRDKDFKIPTTGETVAVVRNYSAGCETIVRGGAVQVTDLPAMTVITVWKEQR